MKAEPEPVQDQETLRRLFNRSSLLTHARQGESGEIGKLLAENPGLASGKSDTVMTEALNEAIKNKHYEAAEALLKAGADASAKLPSRSSTRLSRWLTSAW